MRAWGIYLAIGLGAYAVNWVSQADRDESGAIIAEGQVDAFQLRIGDCFDDTDPAEAGAETLISDVPGVPCSEPHDIEVYAVFDVDAPSFPEGEGMAELAFKSCLKRFPDFVGKDYESSSLDIFSLYPTRESWTRGNDREVICAVYDMNLAKLEGTVRGLAL